MWSRDFWGFSKLGLSGLDLIPTHSVAHQPWKHSIAWFRFMGEVTSPTAQPRQVAVEMSLESRSPCLFGVEIRTEVRGIRGEPVLTSVLSYGNTGLVYVRRHLFHLHSFIHSLYVCYSATSLRHVDIFTSTPCIYHYNSCTIRAISWWLWAAWPPFNSRQS